MVCFIKDVVVITTSEEGLQTALNVINIMFKEYSLKINAAQTKTIVYYKNNSRKQNNYPRRSFQVLRKNYNRR